MCEADATAAGERIRSAAQVLVITGACGRDVENLWAARTHAPRIDAPDLAALTENPLAPRAGVTFALWFAKSEVDDARDQLRAIYAQTLNGACKQARPAMTELSPLLLAIYRAMRARRGRP